jgi:hypothetical protein
MWPPRVQLGALGDSQESPSRINTHTQQLYVQCVRVSGGVWCGGGLCFLVLYGMWYALVCLCAGVWVF